MSLLQRNRYNPQHCSETELVATPTGGSTELSRKSKILDGAYRAVQGAIVSTELLPLTNEGGRFAIMGAVEAATHRNVFLSAGAYSGSTFLLEAVAGVAAASLVTTKRGSKAIEKVNDFADKFVPRRPLARSSEAALAILAGTPVSVLAKQRIDPTRSEAANVRYALKTAAGLAGVCAVEGAIIAETAKETNLIGGAVIGLLAISAGGYAFNKLQSKIQPEVIEVGISDEAANVAIISASRDYETSALSSLTPNVSLVAV